MTQVITYRIFLSKSYLVKRYKKNSLLILKFNKVAIIIYKPKPVEIPRFTISEKFTEEIKKYFWNFNYLVKLKIMLKTLQLNPRLILLKKISNCGYLKFNNLSRVIL